MGLGVQCDGTLCSNSGTLLWRIMLSRYVECGIYCVGHNGEQDFVLKVGHCVGHNVRT